MTDERFDDLTRLASRSTSRRGLLKGAVAAALGGVALRLRGGGSQDAAARARIRMACARFGQPCDTVPGTPANKICCPHLACDADLTCCKPENERCVDDDECCTGNVCRPNPTGLGNRCLPLGDAGAECVEDADCGSNLCDSYTLSCVGSCHALGADCTDVAECCDARFCAEQLQRRQPGDTYCVNCLREGAQCMARADCCGALFCGHNVDLGGEADTYCVTCLPFGDVCAADSDCCGSLICGFNVSDPLSTCLNPPI